MVEEKASRSPSSGLVRWAGSASLLGGAMWTVAGLLYLTNPPASPDTLYNRLLGAVLSAALLGMLVGLVGLHASQVESYGRLGKTGFFAAFAGDALMLEGTAALTLFPNGGTLVWLFSAPGIVTTLGTVAMLFGFVLLGVATLRSRVLPRWSGLALVASAILWFFGPNGGWIALGLLWLALGRMLRLRGTLYRAPPA